MNISYLKNKNIHFVECENWHDDYGYEKSEMKEDTIKYIEQLHQENAELKKQVDKAHDELYTLKNKYNKREDHEGPPYIFF